MKFLKDLEIGHFIIPAVGVAIVAATLMTDRADQNDPSRANRSEAITRSVNLANDSQIAERDWDKCTFVTHIKTDDEGVTYFARIRENDVIVEDILIDGVRQPLPDNTIVCSAFGDYATMVNGRATNVLINQKVEKQKFDAEKAIQGVE